MKAVLCIAAGGIALGLFISLLFGLSYGLSKLVQKLGIDEKWLLVPAGAFFLLAVISFASCRMAADEKHEKAMAEIRGRK